MRPTRALPAVLASIALVAALTPVAFADEDPAQRKKEVDAALAKAKAALDESSAAVASAAKQYETVTAELKTAQQKLEGAQAQLAVAKAEDQRLATELAAATADESRAIRNLDEVQARIEQSQDELGEMAAAAYRNGGVGASQLSAMLDGDTTADLVSRIQGVQTVLRSQQATIGWLADSRAVLASSKAHLVAVREKTADLRQQAADNLALQQRLEADAATAAAAVAEKQREQAAVLAAAKSALADDQKQYDQLTAERKKLEAELAARARAAAEAAARAKQVQQGSSGPLYRPVSGYITSPFGMRMHPITHIYKLHDGTDFHAPCGTAIRAAASGRVLRAYYIFGYGNQTVIENGIINGKSIATSYSHQSKIIVHAGQYVQRGQIIGYSGMTGYATGCHLHFMVYVNGAVTNPMNWL